MTTFRYRTLTHPDHEVELVRFYRRASFSKRGVRDKVTIGMFLKGWVVANPQSSITARIQEVEDAYSYDGGDAVLLLDDGSESPHSLKSSHPTNISGVRVLDFQWVTENPAEYATNRTFTVQLEADYADIVSQIIFWYEQLEFIGNGGPRYELVEFPLGTPLPYRVCEFTKQTIIQSGKSLGYFGYVEPFGSLWPDSLHQDKVRIVRGTPEFNGKLYTNYPMQWTFPHSRSVPTDGTPSLR